MDAVEEGTRGPARARVVSIGLIVGIAFVLPAVVTALGGGFGITRNDDYAFIATMRHFVDGGGFELRGPADMTLIGQILLAWPIAKLTSTDITALQLTTLAVGTIGLLATASFAGAVVDRKRALLVALTAALTPMWAPLTTTFMTDVWAFGLGAVAIALIARASTAATTKGFVAGLVGALAAGAAAFSVRQTALVALAAVLVGAAVALVRMRAERPNRTTERRVAAVLAALTVFGCGLVYRWRSTLGVGGLGMDRLTAYRAVAPLVNADQVLLSIALLVLPASVAFLRRDLVVRRLRACPRGGPVSGLAIGLIVVLKLATRPIDELTLTDYAGIYGPAAYTAPMDKIAIVPVAAWALLILLAAANLWALLLVLSGPALGRCWREQPVVVTIAGTVIIGTLALLAVSWIGSLVRFDRYLLPLVPAVALLIAWVTQLDAVAARSSDGVVEPDEPAPAAAAIPPLVLGRSRVAGLVALLVLAGWFGLASASFDRAVHRAGDAARRETGVTVDAGLTVSYTWYLDEPGYVGLTNPDRSGCWILRQTSDRSKVEGRVLEHDRLLWVDRWFYVVDDPPACASLGEPAG